MARGFGTTSGAGTTDRVTSALTVHGAQRTYAAFVLRNGDAGLGRIFDKGLGSAAAPELAFHNNFNSTYNYQRAWSAATGEWRIARPATGLFFHLAITYDASSVANDPLFYLNGISQSVTEVVAPVGTLVSTTDPYQIGNRQLGTAVWDGQLYRFAVWNRILTQGEIEDLFEGASPLTMATSLAEFLEMGFSQSPITSSVLANPTVIGTVATADPVFVPPVSYGPTNGPLAVHPTNGRYLVNASGAPVFLVGPNTYSVNMDTGTTDPPPVTDWPAFLAGLVAEGHNFLKFWQRENSKSEVVTTGGRYWEPPIWARSATAGAADGKNKHDTDIVNPAYLTRLRDRALDCQAAGIYVSVLFVQGWSLDSKGTGNQIPWLTHPFRAVNNINGINGDPNADNEGTEVTNGTIPAIVAIHDAYIAEVVGALGDLDNIIWEPWNEPTGTTASWAYMERMIGIIRAAETANSFAPKPILASRTWTDQVSNSNAQLLALPGAQIVAPGTWIGNEVEAYGPQYDDATPEINPPVADGSRVISFDTDHNHNNPAFTGANGVWSDGLLARQLLWKNTLRGAGILSMLMLTNNPDFLRPMTNSRGVLKAIRETMHGCVNFAAMTPQNALASTGYCLANAALTGEYLAYLPTGGSVTMDLTASPGAMSVSWINAATGAPTEGAPIQGGGAATVLTSPFGSSDAAVRLTSVPVTVVTFHDQDLTPGIQYTYRVAAEDTATPTKNLSAFSAPLVLTTVGTSVDTEAPSQPGAANLVSRTSMSLTVDWPESTDNVAVTGYTVTAGVSTFPATTPPLTISGLDAWTTYPVTVQAHDAADNDSAVSQSVDLTTLRLARAFTGGQVVRATVLPAITDYPFSVGISVYPTLNDTGFIWSMANHLTNTDFFGIKAQLVSGSIRAHVTGSSSAGMATGASSTILLALNTWQRIIVTFVSSTLRTIRLSGDVVVTDTSPLAFPAGLSRLTVGGIDRLTPVQPYTGRAADPTIWLAALDDVEQATWISGGLAWLTRRGSLVTHSLLHGESPELDLVGSSDFTVVGATTADGPEYEASLTDPTPPGDPGPVPDLVETDTAATSVAFAWGAADFAQLYRIRRLDTSVVFEKAEGDRTFTAEGLLPFTPYTFTVAAVSGQLEGPLSTLTLTTKPVHQTPASGRTARSGITPRP